MMRFSKSRVVLAVGLSFALVGTDAKAHWCDDMWHSAYNIVVRPDSDTSPKQLFVQNNMGYQLPDFKLTATSSSGGAVTLSPPTTLKVANTLLPGEKGVWKITSGNPAKIEDLTFSVAFGLDFSGWTTQDACYPLAGAKPVMVVKSDKSLYPATPTGLASPKAPPSPCVGIVALGRSLQYQAIADFEDVETGLNSLLQYFCAGRASWGIDDAVTKTYCKDVSSTTCPTSPKAFIWQDYVSSTLPSAPEGATVKLYVFQMPSEDQAKGLYTAILRRGAYASRAGMPDDWATPTPNVGAESRIQDTSSQWWINFRKGVFYVEVLLDPSYGPPPDYAPGSTENKQEAVRFAQAIASKI